MAKAKDEWEEVTLAGTHDFATSAKIIGILVRREENVGPNESTLYTLEQPNHERIGVWGSAVLDSRMKNVALGEEVKIEYLGEEVSKQTDRTYKNFKVSRRIREPSKKSEDVDPAEVLT